MKQLRIVGLGDYANYYSYFTYGVLEGAIRCGAWFRPVHLFQTLDDVKSQIDFFKPHIILAHCIFNRRPHKREDVFQLLSDFRRKYGTKIYYHMGDARAEPRYPHDISPFVDGALVNNLELDKWSSIWGVPCIHWPYMALYQKAMAEPDDRFFADVVFTGSLGAKEGYHAERTSFIDELKELLNVKTYPDEVWGNSRFLTAEVSSSSKAVIGTQMGGGVEGYVDVRPWQYIGAGALYFHERHPSMDYYFREDYHYVAFTEIEEFLNKYNWYLDHPVAAKAVRAAGFEYCQKWHNTMHRMNRVLNLYDDMEPYPPTKLKEIEKKKI